VIIKKKRLPQASFFLIFYPEQEYPRIFYHYIRLIFMGVAVKAIVIDDEEDICLLLKSYLRKKHIDIRIASNIEEGIKLVDLFDPDILFLDNNLPDGSGIDSIQLFRSINFRMKIIIISALTNLKEIAMANGADHFLEKPISFENIQNMLNTLEVKKI
jgi:DNA-binding response OmpR family regulator